MPLARDANIHAEIVGYGNSLDAHGISEPHPEGRGAYQAMSRAVADAGVSPDVIDCINAHGNRDAEERCPFENALYPSADAARRTGETVSRSAPPSR